MRVRYFGRAGDSVGSPTHESNWEEIDDDTPDELLVDLAYEFVVDCLSIESWYEVER